MRGFFEAVIPDFFASVIPSLPAFVIPNLLAFVIPGLTRDPSRTTMDAGSSPA